MINSRRNGLCPTLRQVNGEVCSVARPARIAASAWSASCRSPHSRASSVKNEVEQPLQVRLGVPGQSNPEAHFFVFDTCEPALRQACAATRNHDIGIDVLATAAGRSSERSPRARNSAWSRRRCDAGPDRGFDELRQLSPSPSKDSTSARNSGSTRDGRDRGGLHGCSVAHLRCTGRDARRRPRNARVAHPPSASHRTATLWTARCLTVKHGSVRPVAAGRARPVRPGVRRRVDAARRHARPVGCPAEIHRHVGTTVGTPERGQASTSCRATAPIRSRRRCHSVPPLRDSMPRATASSAAR